MKNSSRIIWASAMCVGLTLTASPALAASVDGSTDGAVECWSEMPSGTSVCVPLGSDLATAVKSQTGLDLIEETSPGVATNLITGESTSTSAVPLGAPPALLPAHGLAVSAPTARPFAGGSYVLLKLYTDGSYGGSVWSLSAAGQCIGDGTPWSNADFGATSPMSGYFNNRVSSFHTYYNCASNLYDDANWVGTSTGYIKNASSLGSMNDRANSVNVYVG